MIKAECTFLTITDRKALDSAIFMLSSLFSGNRCNSIGRTSWPLVFDWHIARVLQRKPMDKWHLWGNYTRAHSGGLSLVAPSCWEQLSSLSSLKETTKAVLGIMAQLVLLLLPITDIYFLSFISHRWLWVEFLEAIPWHLRVSRLTAEDKRHPRPLPSPTATSRRGL